MTQRAGIQSVEVGFALLQALAAGARSMMLREVAEAAKMPAAKAHRYLVSFQRLGLVVQDASSSRYELGPAALHLGLAALARIDGVKLARERLGEFKLIHHTTVAIAVWGNRGPTLVHWDDATQGLTVNLRLGDVMPLSRSATGLCFLAFMPSASIEAWIAADGIETTRWQQLKADTLRLGLGRVQDSLVPGIVGFAAPVFDADARLRLAVVALGSSSQLDARPGGSVATALKALADQLSLDLGGKPWPTTD